MSRFKTLVGKENVLETKGDLEAYSSDASMIDGKATSIVMPGQTDEVRRIISFANREKLTLTIRGAGTGLAGGAVPQNDVVMDMSKMNRIIELDRKNQWVVVEPGVVLDDLNKALAKYGLRFPVEPASHTACQIGGMIATDASGSKAIKYGSVKDWIVDLEVVDGAGKFHALGVKKTKEDFIGSEGLYGVITKARLKVVEPEETKSVTFLRFENIQKMVDQAHILKSDKGVCMIEFLDPETAKRAELEPYYYLIIEYENNQGDIKDQEKIADLVKRREAIGPRLTSEEYSVMEDPKIPAEKMAEFLEWLNEKHVPVFGHLAEGIVHPRFKKDQAELIDEMFKKVVEYEGGISGEHGIGLSKKKYLSEDRVSEIKGLKYKYDPNFTLNKGKVI